MTLFWILLADKAGIYLIFIITPLGIVSATAKQFFISTQATPFIEALFLYVLAVQVSPLFKLVRMSIFLAGKFCATITQACL